MNVQLYIDGASEEANSNMAKLLRQFALDNGHVSDDGLRVTINVKSGRARNFFQTHRFVVPSKTPFDEKLGAELLGPLHDMDRPVQGEAVPQEPAPKPTTETSFEDAVVNVMRSQRTRVRSILGISGPK